MVRIRNRQAESMWLMSPRVKGVSAHSSGGCIFAARDSHNLRVITEEMW